MIYVFGDDDELFTYATPTWYSGSPPAPYVTSLTPAAYVEWAVADLADGSDRACVNAMANIKRSLHLAVDTAMHQ